MPRPPAPPTGDAAAFVPSGFFALRTPLLAWDELAAWSEGLRAASVVASMAASMAASPSPSSSSAAANADAATLDAAIAADTALLRARLRALVARPEIREALFVASPSLDESLGIWLDAPASERGQKVERGLVRYFARMAARPTPFGLFAGCSTGTIGARTHLALGPRAASRRHSRLDMDFLFALAEALERDPALRPALALRPSTSLYRGPGGVRAACARLGAPRAGGDKRARSYHLVSVEPTPYLLRTLDRAAAPEGATPGALAAALVADDPEITLDDADAFVAEVADTQLLVGDLAPQVTGDEPLGALVASLTTLAARREARAGEAPSAPAAAAIAARLDEARAALDALDAGGLGHEPARYRAIARGLEGLPAPAELPRLFQVDLVKSSPEATLGPEPIAEMLRAVEILRRLGRPDDTLRRFVEAFVTRFGDEEVALLEALDEESGVGFERADSPSASGEPLIADLPFPPDETTRRWGDRDAFLLARVEAARRAGERAIDLGPADIDRLERLGRPDGAPALPLPDAFAVMATLAAASPEALAAGRFTLQVDSASGPSGAILLGRFCHGDPALTAHVRAHLRAEEAHRPDAVFAEIVHLPEGRIGNVLLRPLLRDHEIPFLGRSGAPPAAQLPPDDLTIAVIDERVVLRSRRLGREVIPRLTTAHNHHGPRNLGPYRLLCALQHQGTAGALAFDWGAVAALGHLPRVTTAGGRVVLALERWRLDRATLEALDKATRAPAVGPAGRFAAVQRLRARLGLPRHVEVADFDNHLPIDLDNALAVDNLLHLVRERPEATLVEPFPSPDALAAIGPEGRYTHELVVPFVRRPPAPPATAATATSPADAAAQPIAPLAPRRPAPLPRTFPRRFPPGSEWLQLKLYTGTALADQVLRGVVRPLVDRALGEGLADGWFFIRYVDPEFHLRLRLHGRPEALLGVVLPAVHAAAAPWLADGRVFNLQAGTYEREVNRYGGPAGIELAERLFGADSECVLSIVESLAGAGDAGADARWRIGLRGIDQLLDDLGVPLDGKHALMTEARRDFLARHRASDSAALERALGERYRRERHALEATLDRAGDADSDYAPALAALGRRSAALGPIAAELRARDAGGRLARSLYAQAGSYVHMFANRLFRAAALAQELVVYDLLARLYEGRIARARKAPRTAAPDAVSDNPPPSRR